MTTQTQNTQGVPVTSQGVVSPPAQNVPQAQLQPSQQQGPTQPMATNPQQQSTQQAPQFQTQQQSGVSATSGQTAPPQTIPVQPQVTTGQNQPVTGPPQNVQPTQQSQVPQAAPPAGQQQTSPPAMAAQQIQDQKAQNQVTTGQPVPGQQVTSGSTLAQATVTPGQQAFPSQQQPQIQANPQQQIGQQGLSQTKPSGPPVNQAAPGQTQKAPVQQQGTQNTAGQLTTTQQKPVQNLEQPKPFGVNEQVLLEAKDTFAHFEEGGIIKKDKIGYAYRALGKIFTDEELEGLLSNVNEQKIDFNVFMDKFKQLDNRDPNDIKKAFEVFDQGKIGKIRASELREILQRDGGFLSPQELDDLLRGYTDQNDLVDYRAMIAKLFPKQ